MVHPSFKSDEKFKNIQIYVYETTICGSSISLFQIVYILNMRYRIVSISRKVVLMIVLIFQLFFDSYVSGHHSSMLQNKTFWDTLRVHQCLAFFFLQRTRFLHHFDIASCFRKNTFRKLKPFKKPYPNLIFYPARNVHFLHSRWLVPLVDVSSVLERSVDVSHEESVTKKQFRKSVICNVIVPYMQRMSYES